MTSNDDWSTKFNPGQITAKLKGKTNLMLRINTTVKTDENLTRLNNRKINEENDEKIRDKMSSQQPWWSPTRRSHGDGNHREILMKERSPEPGQPESLTSCPVTRPDAALRDAGTVWGDWTPSAGRSQYLCLALS